MNATASTTETNDTTRAHSLCRPIEDRMLAGVAVGVADYLDVDVTLVRIALAVLAVIGGAGIPLYLAGWLLIPEAGATQSIASEFLGRYTHTPSH